jgi:hypothetical protein
MIDNLLYRQYTSVSTQSFTKIQCSYVSNFINYLRDDRYTMLEVGIYRFMKWYQDICRDVGANKRDYRIK